ncbi:hypothetical protein JM93_03157 [Roseibium hamelinense]|uniref:Uncharacterized protein n=1 Tax=Roseibium hamelinense TaxID=150831 RepID=A0A562SVQ2_9HYPH|nr:hypothetical protein [Roseibium hamelinense]MTI42536.1 hypothetical protein [Roseibium hamelinense]TWI84820.1 hypothetical protein JM93_03157 [Roseibium hamelinense]
MTSRPSYKQRLAKKAERQREYRKHMKDKRRPSRDDIAVAYFHWLVKWTTRKGGWKTFYGSLEKVTDQLVERGFDRNQTEDAIETLVDKIKSGWEFQRKPDFENSANE